MAFLYPYMFLILYTHVFWQTTGATDFEHFTIGEDIFLAVANAYNYGPQNFQNIDTYYTNSTIFMLNKEKRQFEKIQSIPTFR